MGGNDTTIGLSFETRDMLIDLKIIEEETYEKLLIRITSQLAKDECLLDKIKTVIETGKNEKEIVGELKRILGVK